MGCQLKSAKFAKTAAWWCCVDVLHVDGSFRWEQHWPGVSHQLSHSASSSYLTVLFDLPLDLLPLFVHPASLPTLLYFLPSSPAHPCASFHFLFRSQLPVPAPVPPAGVPLASSLDRCSPACSPFYSWGFGVWLTHGPEPLRRVKKKSSDLFIYLWLNWIETGHMKRISLFSHACGTHSKQGTRFQTGTRPRPPARTQRDSWPEGWPARWVTDGSGESGGREPGSLQPTLSPRTSRWPLWHQLLTAGAGNTWAKEAQYRKWTWWPDATCV